MSSPYIRKTIVRIPVPRHSKTEPGMQALYDAKMVRNERITEIPNVESDKERYLQLISVELEYRSKALKYQVYEIGKLIYQVKEILPYGEFQDWVENNFNQSYRTAVNCMRVFEACSGCPEMVEYFNPSCLYIMCARDYPKQLRAALFENAKGPVDIKKKDLVEAALKYKSGEIDTASDTIQTLLINNRDADFKDMYRIEIRALYTVVMDRLEKIQGLYGDQSYPLLLPKNQKVDLQWAGRIVNRIIRFQRYLEATIKELEDEK